MSTKTVEKKVFLNFSANPDDRDTIAEVNLTSILDGYVCSIEGTAIFEVVPSESNIDALRIEALEKGFDELKKDNRRKEELMREKIESLRALPHIQED